MQPSIIKGINQATPKIKTLRHRTTKALKLQNLLHCNVAMSHNVCTPNNLLVQNTASPGKALIPNGQGTEGIITKLQRLILGIDRIWGLEKN